MFKVTKKDGSVEDFDRAKIVNTVVNAGGSPQDAEQVAAEVEAWMPTAAVGGVVETKNIRFKVIEILKTINPAVATTFEAFKKPDYTAAV